MTTAEKAVHADRIVMQKLENCCNRLGVIVNGTDYKWVQERWNEVIQMLPWNKRAFLFNLTFRIQSDKESDIKNKIIQINIEKKKLKLLGQKPMTPQVPKSVALNSPTVTLAPPKQPSTIKPNVPAAVQVQNIRTNQVPDPVNDREIPSTKSAPTVSTQNDCIKVDALNEMHEKDNNITSDTKDINCKPVETARMQKVPTYY